MATLQPICSVCGRMLWVHAHGIIEHADYPDCTESGKFYEFSDAKPLIGRKGWDLEYPFERWQSIELVEVKVEAKVEKGK